MEDENLILDDGQGVDHQGTNSSISNGALLTVNEVAVILRLKPDTIRSMARRGDLPAIKLGRVWRFKRTSISDLLQA
jgi:excisionase family DNA binding protein